jgi:hypothetical protein
MTDYARLVQDHDAVSRTEGLDCSAQNPPAGNGSDSLEAFRELTVGADALDVAEMLRPWARALPSDPLARVAERNRAVELLSKKCVVGAARMVDAALRNGASTASTSPLSTVADPEALRRDGAVVLDAPDIMAVVGGTVCASGYAGDTNAVQVVYLGVTSRLLPRPVNLFLSGPSAAGKNFAIKAALPLFPSEAVYTAHGQSPLAVMYSSEDFSHRTLIVSEASAFHSDGIGASLMRGLAWDGELDYDTVIDGKPVHLHKDGPTGLITTGTRDLERELGTRVWTVPIADDPTQTRAVLRATAREAAGLHGAPSVPVGAFVAAQRWLAAAGERRVVIPFAGALAELLPDHEVRLRRDFTQLLGLVRAHALLHQCHRERAPDGSIVAVLADYSAVQELVEPMFAASLSEGLDQRVRETVTSVAGLLGPDRATVTASEVAKSLNLSDSGAWLRVKKALRAHYLVNDEPRKGQPAKLRLGMPLPRDERLLPSPQEIAKTLKRESQVTDRQELARLSNRLSPGGPFSEAHHDPDEEAREAMRDGA